MNKWMRKFENAMAAAAFAEAGEPEAAREVLEERRRILLALRAEDGDSNAFRYALNMCKRVGADLEIIHVKEIPADFLREVKTALKKEGVEYLIMRKRGMLEEEIKKHSAMKEDILFVVVEVSQGINIRSSKSDRIISDAWKNLKCPLVVVSQGERAFA